MSSGVTVQPDCITTFNEIKLGHKYRYIIYSITDDLKEIKVNKSGPPSCTYENFVDELKEAENLKQCRYGVYDAEYTLKDDHNRSKLVFFLWSPECATVKQKMIYTSSKTALRKSLVGVAKEIQACDYGDLEWDSVLEILQRTAVA